MDKPSIKPLDTQAALVGKCGQRHDVRHWKEILFFRAQLVRICVLSIWDIKVRGLEFSSQIEM